MTPFSLKPILSALTLMLIFVLAACQSDPETAAEDDTSTPPVVELTMVDHAYAAPDSIPSGWVTFQMENIGEETHEFALRRLPQGKNFKDLHAEYIEPLDSLQQLRLEETIGSDVYREAVQKTVPDWFSKMQTVGGGARLGAGQTAQATLKLEPDNYAMMCTVRSPSGHSHFLQGMARPITVTEAGSGASPPTPDVTIRSAGREISVEGRFAPGDQTVALHVERPPESLRSPYAFAYLAPLGPETDVEKLRNFVENEHSIEFLGGFLAVPTGQTRYSTVNLEPGRYGWVFPHGKEKYLVREFTVE